MQSLCGQDQTMQAYANLKVFPLQQRIVWAGNIMTPVGGVFSNDQMTR